MPGDWPTSVPVVSGPLVVSTSSGSEPAKVWVLEVLVDDLAAARAQVTVQLSGAGFTTGDESTAADGTYQATFRRTSHTVKVLVYHEAETGENEIRYLVQGASVTR